MLVGAVNKVRAISSLLALTLFSCASISCSFFFRNILISSTFSAAHCCRPSRAFIIYCQLCCRLSVVGALLWAPQLTGGTCSGFLSHAVLFLTGGGTENRAADTPLRAQALLSAPALLPTVDLGAGFSQVPHSWRIHWHWESMHPLLSGAVSPVPNSARRFPHWSAEAQIVRSSCLLVLLLFQGRLWLPLSAPNFSNRIPYHEPSISHGGSCMQAQNLDVLCQGQLFSSCQLPDDGPFLPFCVPSAFTSALGALCRFQHLPCCSCSCPVCIAPKQIWVPKLGKHELKVSPFHGAVSSMLWKH